MASGISERNKLQGVSARRQAFGTNASTTDSPIRLGIDLSARSRWLRHRDAAVKFQASLLRHVDNSQPGAQFQS